MEAIAKSDLFFFVTTIAVVIVTIVLIIALIYLVRILRDANRLSSRAREEGEALLGDISSAREKVKSEGVRFWDIVIALLKKSLKRKK